MSIAQIQLNRNDVLVIPDHVGKPHVEDILAEAHRQDLQERANRAREDAFMPRVARKTNVTTLKPRAIDDSCLLGQLPVRVASKKNDNQKLIGNSTTIVTNRIFGDHKSCGGSFELLMISKSLQLIKCDKCPCCIDFPMSVKTYGQLRAHFAPSQPQSHAL